jgi:type II restriction enzyme
LKLNCSNAAEVFQYLANTLNDSITYWDYFVNWEKVLGNTRDLEIDLNILNYLVGKDDVEKEFKILLTRHPSLTRLIPILLACRESNFQILTSFASGDLHYEQFAFDGTLQVDDHAEKACRFARETGLLDLFKNKRIKSVPDYVLGVEVGLDSNGRKNRGGTAMESIVESILAPICGKSGLVFLKQATADTVRNEWGISVPVDKTSRRFDFAVKHNDTLYLIETNYYRGGGSKLKATAGEYKSLYDLLSSSRHKLIWITDGLGWKSTLRPLEETFNHLDCVLNLKMVTMGVLECILNHDL